MGKSATNQRVTECDDALVGRQSIYNRNLSVYGYELLYRPSGSHNETPESFDGNLATSDVMANAFLELGLESIVENKHVFINLTESYIDGSIPLAISSKNVVLEVLENVQPTPEVIEGIQSLKKQGFVIALDDFTFDYKITPLISLADIIKIDIMNMNPQKLADGVVALKKNFKGKLLAEKIETTEEWEVCKSLKFDYFQGYFLERPVIIKGQKIPSNKLAILFMLSRLQDPNIEVEELQQLTKKDVALCYKLLRYINSPAFNLEVDVTSIKQAIVLLGLQSLKRWVSLIVMSGLSEKSPDLIHKALFRAKMCETLAKKLSQDNPEDYFLAGLFSVLDAMLDKDKLEILEPIPINKMIKDAILNGSGKIGKVLKCTFNYEHGIWSDLTCGKLSQKKIKSAYLESIVWADEQVIGISSL